MGLKLAVAASRGGAQSLATLRLKFPCEPLVYHAASHDRSIRCVGLANVSNTISQFIYWHLSLRY